MSDGNEILDFDRAQIDADERWALAASRPYEYADEGSTAPPGGVHWRWVAGENWDTVQPDPAVMEFVEGPDGSWSANLATVEEWPSTLRIDDEHSRTRMVPRVYANTIVEMDSAAAGHVIRNDPARVLAEVDTKRRILDLHRPVSCYDGPSITVCHTCGPHGDNSAAYGSTTAEVQWWPCDTVKLLTLPYADHPDYRPEWRPA